MKIKLLVLTFLMLINISSFSIDFKYSLKGSKIDLKIENCNVEFIVSKIHYEPFGLDSKNKLCITFCLRQSGQKPNRLSFEHEITKPSTGLTVEEKISITPEEFSKKLALCSKESIIDLNNLAIFFDDFEAYIDKKDTVYKIQESFSISTECFHYLCDYFNSYIRKIDLKCIVNHYSPEFIYKYLNDNYGLKKEKELPPSDVEDQKSKELKPFGAPMQQLIPYETVFNKNNRILRGIKKSNRNLKELLKYSNELSSDKYKDYFIDEVSKKISFLNLESNLGITNDFFNTNNVIFGLNEISLLNPSVWIRTDFTKKVRPMQFIYDSQFSVGSNMINGSINIKWIGDLTKYPDTVVSTKNQKRPIKNNSGFKSKFLDFGPSFEGYYKKNKENSKPYLIFLGIGATVNYKWDGENYFGLKVVKGKENGLFSLKYVPGEDKQNHYSNFYKTTIEGNYLLKCKDSNFSIFLKGNFGLFRASFDQSEIFTLDGNGNPIKQFRDNYFTMYVASISLFPNFK
jgi:hypothetical protein